MDTVFAVNENNDMFARADGSLALSTGIQAVLEACQHAVEVRQDELIYSRTEGIDYMGLVFNGSPNLLLFEAQARQAIMAVTDVESILSFSAEVLANTLTYSATIQTTLGLGELDGNV